MNWLGFLAALAAALRELFRLVASAADRRASREAAERDAKAYGYDKLAKATRARQAVRDKLAKGRAAQESSAASRAAESEVSHEDEKVAVQGGDVGASAGPASDGVLPDKLDKYRRD